MLALALPFCFVPGANFGPTVLAQSDPATLSSDPSTSADDALATALGTPALAGHLLVSPAVADQLASKPAPAAKVVKPKVNASKAPVTRTKVAKAAPRAWVQPVPTTPLRRYATYTLMATAYNSLPSQTDGDPFITATGAHTRFGIVALSRDMLRRIPYGSSLRLEDVGGRYSGAFAGTTFIVEDTMNVSKYQQIDVWFPAYSQAVQFGVRTLRITVLRPGRAL